MRESEVRERENKRVRERERERESEKFKTISKKVIFFISPLSSKEDCQFAVLGNFLRGGERRRKKIK